MKAQVYTLHIAYVDYEDKISRTVEVSGNNTVAQLGYLILHTFDTLAYHAFEFTHKDTPYVLPMILEETDIEGAIDATQAKLHELGLSVDEEFTMEYDYGCSHTFNIKVLAVSDMPRGAWKRYPRILEGKGRGILDDISPEQFASFIEQIDSTGKSDIHVTRDGRDVIWDYRDFKLEAENILLKFGVDRVRRAYEGESYFKGEHWSAPLMSVFQNVAILAMLCDT